MMSQKISSHWRFHIPAYKCQEDSQVHKCWIWKGPEGRAALVCRNCCSDHYGLLCTVFGARREPGEFSTSSSLLAFIYSCWIQSSELKSCSGRGMFLPFHGSFIHCAQANSKLSFFLSNWMHAVSLCKETSDSSSVQTFQFINLLLECRCQNWSHCYSNGLSDAIYRVNIVSRIPIAPVMHRMMRLPLLLPPLFAQTIRFCRSRVSYGHWRWCLGWEGGTVMCRCGL